MDVQHTPGPWHTVGLDKNAQRVVASQHIEIATCWHHCVGSIEREMEANARLIAAAPEILEALTMIHRIMIQRDMVEDEREVVDQAWAAINKAKGGQ